VNTSTLVAGQFPSQAYLFVYIISKAWGWSASLWRPSIQVVGHECRLALGHRYACYVCMYVCMYECIYLYIHNMYV